MDLVLGETAQGKTIANCLLGIVAGFFDLLTELPQEKGLRVGWEKFDLEPHAGDFLELGRHFPVAGPGFERNGPGKDWPTFAFGQCCRFF